MIGQPVARGLRRLAFPMSGTYLPAVTFLGREMFGWAAAALAAAPPIAYRTAADPRPPTLRNQVPRTGSMISDFQVSRGGEECVTTSSTKI